MSLYPNNRATAVYDVMRQGISIYLFTRDKYTQKEFRAEITMVEHKIAEDNWAPFTLDKHEAQNLMDSLWGCGIRPTDMQYTSETIEVLKEHLVDLRKAHDALIMKFKQEPKEILLAELETTGGKGEK
jgi:hypothetical protein